MDSQRLEHEQHCVRIRLPLPVDTPFTRAEAEAWGVSGRELNELVRAGRLCHPVRGIYHDAGLEDCIELRIECLRLVMPADSVVTDRTAAWLLGATTPLAPGDHLEVPPVSMFRPPGYRLRNKLAASGERMLGVRDVVELGGIKVTSSLRTACDLGRLLRRDQAFAAMDGLMAVGGFTNLELVRELERFKGYRGVRQARELAPDVDPRSQSASESILRRRWLDMTALPRPELQWRVSGPGGASFYLDLAAPELRYAAEYDGAEWHTDDAQRAHDQRRRNWITSKHGYIIDVLVAADLYGPHANPWGIIQDGVERAQERLERADPS